MASIYLPKKDRSKIRFNLKKTEVKLDLLLHVHMLPMVEKDTRCGMCHAVYWYGKYNDKYMKDQDPSKESSNSYNGVSVTNSMDE